MRSTLRKYKLFHSIKPLIKILFFSLIFVCTLFGQTQKDINIFSPQNKLKFADHLFCDQDYLRSYEEYRSFLRTSGNDTARFKMAYSLAEIGRFGEAGDNYKSLFYNSNLSDESRLEFHKANFFSGNYKLFREEAEIEAYYPGSYGIYLDRLIGLSHFIYDPVIPDSAGFFRMFDDSSKVKLLALYKMKRDPNYKNETTAGLLSAIVPGLGKAYVGEYGDGITAFLMTGLFTFLAVDNFNHDHNFRGWLFGGLAAYFYAGNIYGSVSAAQIYNAGIKFSFDNELNIYLNSKNYFLPKYDFLCR